MSFLYFLYLFVVSNAIGAFTAFIGGLSDKIGRANLTIYGTFIVGLVQLVAVPHIHSEVRLRPRLLRDRVRRGRSSSSRPRRSSATSHRRWGAERPWGSGRSAPPSEAWWPAGRHPHPPAPPPVAGPVRHLRARVHGRGVPSPSSSCGSCRPSCVTSSWCRDNERALVEARAKGIDVEKATRAPDAVDAAPGPHRLVTGDLAVPAHLFRVGQRPHAVLGGDLQSHHRRCQRNQHVVLRRPVTHAGVLRRRLRPVPGPQAVHADRSGRDDRDDRSCSSCQIDHPPRVTTPTSSWWCYSACPSDGLHAVDGELHRAGRSA